MPPSFFVDLRATLHRLPRWLYVVWLTFLVRYRKTAVGPLWLLIGPTLFIATLGVLFTAISNQDPAVFVPHLAIGLVVWTLMSGFITGSTTIFMRSRPQVMQGNMSVTDLVSVDLLTTCVQFLHQVVIIIAVFVIFRIVPGPEAAIALAGLVLMVANGLWLSIVFGIVGARYRDLAEIVQALMRIAFLATPIIWMPEQTERGAVLAVFLIANPFHHFLELVRAPLLGEMPSLVSWAVVLTITAIGVALAARFYRRYARQVPLWL